MGDGRRCARTWPVHHPRIVGSFGFIVVLMSFAAGEAQFPPDTGIYELVEILPPPPPIPCECVKTAFALPAFRPGRGWGVGPTTPTEHAPLSDERRWYVAERVAKEREGIAHNVEEGLAGKGHSSLIVAAHLTDTNTVVGDDPRIEEETSRWLHLAATQNDPAAFISLAYRYQRGKGVAQSDEAAAYWLYRSAMRDGQTAMVALGLRYANGRGVAQDFGAAVYWWRKASGMQKTSVTQLARRFLGDAHACGLGVNQDRDRAVREYSNSADGGEMSSNIQIGRMYLSGCAAANDEAMAKAFKRAADAGHHEAQIALSDLFLQGRGVEQDSWQAYYWARIAERRLPEGEQRTLASTRAEAAARLMPPDMIAAAEAVVESMMAATPRR